MTFTLDRLRRGDLAGARTLKLDGGLTALPEEVFGLSETLEVLDLSGNRLTALPQDLGRLKRLRVLFCSGNPFERLPPVLGDCAALSQVGFRGSGMREVPAEALPHTLRWLTLTDNRIARLPDEIGRRPWLQKLMLAGNRLTEVPESLAGAPNLELLRLSANRLERLPSWVTRLPRLAWLAYAGNPFEDVAFDGAASEGAGNAVPWSDLDVGALLGEGASGQVFEAGWRGGDPGASKAVALKLFKGAMTSDGLPEREMQACLAAGDHPHLLGALGRLTGHPQGVEGLVTPRLPAHWRPLAGPPSLERCTRDVYDPGLRLDLDIALSVALQIGAATAHLHGRGLLHGDLYAHNVLWDGQGQAMLSDFGAAGVLPDSDAACGLERLDVRAWGVLLDELLDLASASAIPAAVYALRDACLGEAPAERPSMADALETLKADLRSTRRARSRAPSSTA